MNCPVTNRTSARELQIMHLSADKNEIYKKYAPVRLAESDGVTYVFDGKLAASIMKSPSFSVVSLADEYRKLSVKTGINFDAITATMDVMPLFIAGDEHKDIRNEMSAIMMRDIPAQEATVEKTTDAILGKFLKADAKFDLQTDLTLPLYHALTATLVGVDWEQTFITDDYPRLLDPVLGLNRRKSLNKSLEVALKNHQDGSISEYLIMALVMLGHDTYVGATAAAIWHVLDKNPGKRLNEIEWPRRFPLTSAPYTDRMVVEDWQGDGLDLRAGQRVRLVLDASAEFGPLENQDLIFGKGRHVCIGRKISEFTWRLVTDRLSRSELFAQTETFEFRVPDSCFCYPISSEVSFHV